MNADPAKERKNDNHVVIAADSESVVIKKCADTPCNLQKLFDYYQSNGPYYLIANIGIYDASKGAITIINISDIDCTLMYNQVETTQILEDVSVADFLQNIQAYNQYVVYYQKISTYTQSLQTLRLHISEEIAQWLAFAGHWEIQTKHMQAERERKIALQQQRSQLLLQKPQLHLQKKARSIIICCHNYARWLEKVDSKVLSNWQLQFPEEMLYSAMVENDSTQIDHGAEHITTIIENMMQFFASYNNVSRQHRYELLSNRLKRKLEKIMAYKNEIAAINFSHDQQLREGNLEFEHQMQQRQEQYECKEHEHYIQMSILRKKAARWQEQIESLQE